MRRLAAALTGAALLALPLGFAPGAAPPAAAAAPDENAVTVTVADVSPNTPTPTATPKRISFSLTLHNTTDEDIPDVVVTADRSDPISSSSQLEDAVAKLQPPDPDQVSPIDDTEADAGTIPAGATVDLVFRTTTATDGSAGICLCANSTESPLLVYPIYFTATSTSADAKSTVGAGQTYLPAFSTTDVAPLRVSWLWPILDRPHRLGSERYFLDDDLTTEVASGGKLDRALQTIELLPDDVPVTLLVDPDLLDELEVMKSGNYRVYDSKAKSHNVAGVGASAADIWLDRFKTLLAERPDVELQLTPYADPAIDALATNGLTWATSMTDQAAQRRLADALGARIPQRDLAWPVGGTLHPQTLATVVRSGVGTVVLNDTALPRGRTSTSLDALASIPTEAGTAVAAITSGQLEHDVYGVVRPGEAGLADLPELVSELALRVGFDSSPYVLLAPPRDPGRVDPVVAARAITATTTAFWAEPIGVGTAARTVTPSNHGTLRTVNSPRLPIEALDALRTVSNALPSLSGSRGLFDPSSSAAAPAGALSPTKIATAMQRAVSSSNLGNPTRIARQCRFGADRVAATLAGVHLVRPAGNATYTLTSTDAPLPVTVTNTLDQAVQARVNVVAVNNLPGFSASPVEVHLNAGATQQLRIPTEFTRPGRIQVQVTLTTLDGMALGDGPLEVSVRNTALGTIGVAITTTAAIVLALALLFRLYRAIRWRRRRNRSGTPLPPAVTDPLAP